MPTSSINNELEALSGLVEIESHPTKDGTNLYSKKMNEQLIACHETDVGKKVLRLTGGNDSKAILTAKFIMYIYNRR